MENQQVQQTFSYRGEPDGPDSPPRAAHGGDRAFRRGLHSGLALAARLSAEAESVPEAVTLLVRALNAAGELRDAPEFVPDLANEIARRARS